MCKKIYFIILLVFVGCGASQVKESGKETAISNNGPDGLKARASELVETSSKVSQGNIFNLESDSLEVARVLMFLSSDELQGRDTGSAGIEKAATFLEKELKLANVLPYFNSYRDTIANYTKTAFNVVGFVEGNDATLKKEFIVIGAHYDHIGEISGATDSIANGANDNASGTTTVLQLAKYFGKNKTNKRSLLFVFFTAEEKGLLGSKHLASRLKADNFNLYTMLNFEMVGVPLVGKDYLMYVTGYNLSNLASVSNRYSGENLIGYLPKAKEYNLFKRSDNYAFHTAFNVPSQTFCTFDFTNFNHYHKVGDEFGLMDITHMVNLIQKSIPVVEGIANATIQEIKY